MHLAKHMQFHGVEYLVVPRELWDEAKARIRHWDETADCKADEELLANMQAYDNSNEPEEIPNV